MKIYELCQQGELVIRIIIAALIGCMIGYERKNREKSAGLRTHAIVCMGAALMMVVSKYISDRGCPVLRLKCPVKQHDTLRPQAA